MESFMLFQKVHNFWTMLLYYVALKITSSSNGIAFIMLNPQSLIHKLLSQENFKNFLPQ